MYVGPSIGPCKNYIEFLHFDTFSTIQASLIRYIVTHRGTDCGFSFIIILTVHYIQLLCRLTVKY